MKFCFGFPHRMGLYTAAVMTAVQGLVVVYTSILLLEGFSVQCNIMVSATEKYYLTYMDEHDTPYLNIIATTYNMTDSKPNLHYFLTITQAILGFFFLPIICMIIIAMIFLTSTLIWQNKTLIVEYLILEFIIILYMYLGTLNGLARGYWIYLFALIFITFMVYLWAIVLQFLRRLKEQQKTEQHFTRMKLRKGDHISRRNWSHCNLAKF